MFSVGLKTDCRDCYNKLPVAMRSGSTLGIFINIPRVDPDLAEGRGGNGGKWVEKRELKRHDNHEERELSEAGDGKRMDIICPWTKSWIRQ